MKEAANCGGLKCPQGVGSKADMSDLPGRVRCTPNSGHSISIITRAVPSTKLT